MKVFSGDFNGMQLQAELEISRDEIFEESNRKVMKMQPKELRQWLMVKFRGEEGLAQEIKVFRGDFNAMESQAGHCCFEVSRDEIFEESNLEAMKMQPNELMVKFRGKEGIDRGGIASFNRVESYEKFLDKLTCAVEERCGFTVE